MKTENGLLNTEDNRKQVYPKLEQWPNSANCFKWALIEHIDMSSTISDSFNWRETWPQVYPKTENMTLEE